MEMTLEKLKSLIGGKLSDMLTSDNCKYDGVDSDNIHQSFTAEIDITEDELISLAAENLNKVGKDKEGNYILIVD